MRVDRAAYACLWLLLPGLPFLTAAASPLAGDAACSACHTTQTAHYRATPMGQALETVAVCNILKQHADLSFQEGPYQSRIVRQGDRSTLTVTRAGETLTVPLLWAFGLGQAGQTYVFEYNGAFYESRVSFFYALGALDLTMGAANTKPQTILEAAGRHMSSMEARDCFGCHSNGGVSDGKLHMDAMIPGVGCESCHVAAAKHANAVRAGCRRAPCASSWVAPSCSEKAAPAGIVRLRARSSRL